MPLMVIGAGFGRTGTLRSSWRWSSSGLGPCHHMRELFEHPEQIPLWEEATDGAAVDWEALLAGYRSIVDWPGCHFWRELTERYPAAKVILTVRDPKSWYRSASETIFRALREKPKDDPVAQAQWRLARKMILQQTFGGSTADEALAIGVLEMHNAEVERDDPGRAAAGLRGQPGLGAAVRVPGRAGAGRAVPEDEHDGGVRAGGWRADPGRPLSNHCVPTRHAGPSRPASSRAWRRGLPASCA